MTFEQKLISDYLRLESIETVFREKKYNLPISFAGYARVLIKNKIVTTAGPNSHLSETLYLLSLLKDYQGSLSRLSKKINISISIKTLYRILHAVRNGITRRYGAALLIEDIEKPNKFLLGRDSSLRGAFGSRGDWSLPMSHTRQQDSHYTSVLRVLQREAFTKQAITGNFPYEILNQNLKPSFSIDIADINVRVYHLKHKFNQNDLFSFKLSDFSFLSLREVQNLKTRPGVKEIITHHENKDANTSLQSDLNNQLLFLPVRSKIS